MGFPLDETPAYIKTRLWKNGGLFHVLQREGAGWKPIYSSKDEGKATACLEKTLSDEIGQWSLGVKIAGGWVCIHCGELDKELLESHHIKPKHLYPALADDSTNGECICLRCHAKAHKHDVVVQNMILARLARILYKRLYPKKELYGR